MEAKERADDVERELRAVRQLQAQRTVEMEFQYMMLVRASCSRDVFSTKKGIASFLIP